MATHKTKLAFPEAAATRPPQDEMEIHSIQFDAVETQHTGDPASADLNDKGLATVEQIQSIWEPRLNIYRLAAVCLSALLNGFSDAGAGAIIPHMEVFYNIGYAVVSLIFVGQALGYIVAAIILDPLRAKFGRANVLAIGNISLILGYIPVVAAAPYPLIPVAFFFVGFGAAINMALGNIFCASLQNATFVLGLLHGCYGIGGTISPLIATVLVVVTGNPWNRFYLIPLGISVCTLGSSVAVFWNYDQKAGPVEAEKEEVNLRSIFVNTVSTLRMRIVLLGAIFIFSYQGAEVSISGWVISFLIDTRHGDPAKVGYVTAGFWAGITIGRFVLSVPAQRWGERRFVFGFTLVALLFELLIWLVPNFVSNAVSVAIAGLMLGPIYPCAAAIFMRNMNKSVSLRGMVAISAFGSLGGAIAPFLTGLLAQVVGTFVLHPIVIGLEVVMLFCWFGIPSSTKRGD